MRVFEGEEFDHLIGHIRSQCTVLCELFLVDYLSKCGAEEVPLIGRIVPLCCALCSLSESVVCLGSVMLFCCFNSFLEPHTTVEWNARNMGVDEKKNAVENPFNIM